MNSIQPRKHALLIVLGLLGALLMAACSASSLEVGDPAPAFDLQKAGGGQVALDDYVERQPVLLYFHMALG